MNVFVYGTLQADHSNAHWLDPFADERTPGCLAAGHLLDLPGLGFPAAVFEAGPANITAERFVRGELVHIAPEHEVAALEALDYLEGVDRGLYERVEVSVVYPRGIAKAWAYSAGPDLMARAEREATRRFDTFGEDE